MRRFAVAAVLTTIALAGCGNAGERDEARPLTVTVTTEAGPVDPTAGACTVYRRGSGEYVIARGAGAGAACNAIVHKWSTSLTFWSTSGTPSSDVDFVCAMTRGTVELDVYDVPGFAEGESTCGALAGAGFVEQPPGD